MVEDRTKRFCSAYAARLLYDAEGSGFIITGLDNAGWVGQIVNDKERRSSRADAAGCAPNCLHSQFAKSTFSLPSKKKLG